MNRSIPPKNEASSHRPYQVDASRIWLLTAISLLLCFAGAGCSREEATPLRVGTIVWPGYEPLYVARHLGYLDEKQVRLAEYTSTSEILRAFRNGAIDAGCLTLDESLRLAQEVPDLRLVLVMDISHGADVIMAKPEIASVKDLKGRRVGAETTALGAYVLLRALQISGLTREDVEIVPLDGSEHEAAFKQGSIDAVVTFDPARAKLRAFGARQIFDSTQIPGELVDVLAVRGAYVQAHPETVQHLLRAYYRERGYSNENPKEAARISAIREKTTPEEFLTSLESLRLPDAKESRQMLMGSPPALLKNAQALAAVMREQGLLSKDVNAQTLFDEQALKRVFP